MWSNFLERQGINNNIIIKHLSKFQTTKDVSVIAMNMEKYLSFQLDGIRFVDSLQFLNCGLDVLVKNLVKEGHDKFVHMRRLYPNEEKFKLLLKKGVYPYEYMDDFARLAETSLPPQEEFFSHLSDDGISDEDYAHACKVWVKFAMSTLKEYHDRYLETDVILLADVFEAFRAMALEAYKLDPLHYYSSPGLSFDACLKKSNVPLDLFSTPDKYLLIERRMHGGVSMTGNRYAKANYPYLDQGYDEHKPNNYIMYLDCNNLYGYAMSEPVPTGKFRFLDQEEIDNFDVLTKMDENTKGIHSRGRLGVPGASSL